MADAKHTPGPWRLGRMPIQGGTAVSINSDDWSQFATVVVRKYAASSNDLEGVANADLIAAAPDLLEALTELADRCGSVRPFHNDVSLETSKDGLSAARFLTAVDKARAAIAKALGEEARS